MRKIIAFLVVFLAAAAGWTGDYFTVGGMWGFGSNVSDKVDVQKQDLEHQEVFAAITLEEETFLTLRAGRIQPRKEGPTDLDLDYLGLTVTYLLDTPLGSTGFYGGPSYYMGDIVHFNPELPAGTQRWTEDVNKFGATGGVEAFFPLSRAFQVYAQIAGHYIPADEEQFTMHLGVGLSVRF
jgi:hypothetical protein